MLRRTIYLFVVFVLISGVTYANDTKKSKNNCTGVKVKKTPFGEIKGDEVGKLNGLTMGIFQGAGLFESNEKLSATFVFFQFGQAMSVIEAGSTISIVLENSKIIELKTLQATTPNPQVNDQGVWTEWHIEIPVDQEFIEKIAESSMAATKVLIGGKEVIVEFSALDKKKLKKIAACILQDLTEEK